MMINKEENKDIYITDLISVLWEKKFLICLITVFITSLSIIYALFLPNIYTSQVLLKPSDHSEVLSSKIGAYSSIAGFAGINISGESSSKTQEAVERIKSIDFFSKNFLPYIKLENLMAVESWDFETDKLSYKKKLYDSDLNKWVRNVKKPKKLMPSSQEAFEEYLKILSVSQDAKTSFVKISIKHHSPSIAKRWVDLIERNINISMREADMELSKDSIDFLNSKIAETNLKELKDSISKLLESQIETLMVASVDEKYVFKTISSAIIPEERSEPNRFLLVLLGLVIGFFTGSIIILVHYFLNIQKIVD